MHLKFHVMFIILISLTIEFPAFAQEPIERRLDRIEAKLDTLLAYHRSKVPSGISENTISDSLNLLWGMTSRKGTLLDKRYFVINHDDSLKIPYWVAYHLSVVDLQGTAEREEDFRPDPQLPLGSRSELADYSHSGYDRGHNAPAADFKRSLEAMSETFLLSNMSPQTPELNRRIWSTLEGQVRDLVRIDGEAWIVTGNIFMSTDSQCVNPTEFIGENRVAVPTHCFKVVLSKRADGTFMMYAFLIPNQREHISGTPADYILTVDRVETITKYDFFPDLDDSLENSLESTVPDVWPR